MPVHSIRILHAINVQFIANASTAPAPEFGAQSFWKDRNIFRCTFGGTTRFSRTTVHKKVFIPATRAGYMDARHARPGGRFLEPSWIRRGRNNNNWSASRNRSRVFPRQRTFRRHRTDSPGDRRWPNPIPPMNPGVILDEMAEIGKIAAPNLFPTKGSIEFPGVLAWGHRFHAKIALRCSTWPGPSGRGTAAAYFVLMESLLSRSPAAAAGRSSRQAFAGNRHNLWFPLYAIPS